MKKYTFKVDKKEVSVTDQELAIRDTDVSKSASDIAYWGEVVAALKKLLNLLLAEYRNWRAKAVVKILETDPKLAEWKCKANIESTSGFMKYKKATAEAQEQYDRASGIFEAMVTKASSKQSLLKVRGAQAPYTGGLDQTDPDNPEDTDKQAKIDAMKKARAKRRDDNA